jgi:hypothetical protein
MIQKLVFGKAAPLCKCSLDICKVFAALPNSQLLNHFQYTSSLKWILFTFVFLYLKGTAQEIPIVERVRSLEEERGYYSSREKLFRGILGAELLYWKADIDGVAYATTSKLVKANGGFGNLNTSVKTRTPHFSYDPGFRLTLGVQSPFDLFDVVLVWTRFYTEGHDRAHGTRVPAIAVPDDQLIFDDIGLIKTFTSIPNNAKAECHFKGNLFDVQLGRGIEMSDHFFFRPYFGVRAVWSDLNWNISVTRTFIFPEIFGQESTQLKVNNDFRAVGGLFGMFVDWKLPMGFGVTSRAAGALVYGRTSESTHQDFIFVPPFSGIQIEQDYKAHNSFHSVKGLWELFGGVYWQSEMPKQKKYQTGTRHFQVRLIAGYEFQQWPTIAQKTNVQVSRERERFSLGFQGFSGGIAMVY